MSLRVDSKLEQNRIEATIECTSDRRPRYVELRLPHPLGMKASGVTGGTYDPASERVRIEPFSGKSRITLWFGEERK